MESMREFSDRIADALDSGSVPWRAVEDEAGLPRRFDGRPFGGASVLSLWMAGQEKGFERPTWLSRQRLDELGGRLKAGAAPATTFLRGRRPQRQPGPEGGLATVEVWQPSEVWCVDEIEGLSDHLYRKADEFLEDVSQEEFHDTVHDEGEFGIWGQWLGRGREVGDMKPGRAAVDLVGWTASPARMNRDLHGLDEALVADIGGAVLLAERGIATRALSRDRAPGPEAWGAGAAARIRDDERTIFRVARNATDAVAWLRREAWGKGYATFRVISVRSDHRESEWEVIMSEYAERRTLEAARDARRQTGEALGFRHRPVPAGDDGGAWRAKGASLIQDLAGLDLESARVRAAVEAEVAVAAAGPGDVVSAETFVADFCEVTQRRLQMADLATQHTRAMSIGETSLRI